MKIQTLNLKTITQETQLELPAFRLETRKAIFDIREETDGSLHLRVYDKTLVIVARDSSSAIIVAAPFDDQWIAGVNGKAYTGE
jgi:hypothetical protein